MRRVTATECDRECRNCCSCGKTARVVTGLRPVPCAAVNLLNAWVWEEHGFSRAAPAAKSIAAFSLWGDVSFNRPTTGSTGSRALTHCSARRYWETRDKPMGRLPRPALQQKSY